jgi:hypothetical protein
MEQLDTEIVEMSRAYFDAQPSWHGRKPTQPVPGRRVSSWR